MNPRPSSRADDCDSRRFAPAPAPLFLDDAQDVDKIAENHKHGEPYTQDELNRIQRLEDQQRVVQDGCKTALAPPAPGDIPWTTIAVGVGIVGLAVLGVVYAPEIKHALSRARE